MATVEFWFEFASTYSYLSVMRLERVSAARGVDVVWRPFLLGPIFAKNGWNTSPFNLYPDKGRYMWRDVARQAAHYDLPFERPPASGPGAFPQNGLHCARLALVGLKKDWGVGFCKNAFSAQFANGQDIGDPNVARAIARQSGAPEADLETAVGQPNKTELREQTERAIALGIFGAPSFTVGEELFWGDDRLDDALAFATAAGRGEAD